MGVPKPIEKAIDPILNLIVDSVRDFERISDGRDYAAIVESNLANFLNECLDDYYRREWVARVRLEREFKRYLWRQGVDRDTARTYAWYKIGRGCGNPAPEELVDIPAPIMEGLDRFYKSFRKNKR